MGSKKSFFWEDLEPEKLWYLVGVVTSDGSLSGDKRHIDITSKDFLWLESIKKEAGILSKIATKINGHGSLAFRLQIGSISFYKFLLSVGLFANKSLTLGKMKVPRKCFAHFLRGVIDGDGCIRKWKYQDRKGVQWYLKISAGSRDFLDWLNAVIEQNFNCSGSIYFEKNKYGTCGQLKICKQEGLRKLFAACYGHGVVLYLPRKQEKALEYLEYYNARVVKSENTTDLKSVGP